jgi:hypothetical protein
VSNSLARTEAMSEEEHTALWDMAREAILTQPGGRGNFGSSR